jgi:hypothetical protein
VAGFMSTVMSLSVPCKAVNSLTSLATISFSRMTLLHGVRNTLVHSTIKKMKPEIFFYNLEEVNTKKT